MDVTASVNGCLFVFGLAMSWPIVWNVAWLCLKTAGIDSSRNLWPWAREQAEMKWIDAWVIVGFFFHLCLAGAKGDCWNLNQKDTNKKEPCFWGKIGFLCCSTSSGHLASSHIASVVSNCYDVFLSCRRATGTSVCRVSWTQCWAARATRLSTTD